jgi:SAM-dependent methyltransferase
LQKPFGYAGDFKIIDNIYQDKPRTTGFDRLWDNYFQQLAISKSVRERKKDLKKMIFNFIKSHKKQDIRIMNLGSGSVREIKELVEVDYENLFSKVIFDSYDFNVEAINYAKSLLKNVPNVNFFQKDAIRIALKKDIKNEISRDYDLVYSAGLFCYLDDRIAVRLIVNLKRLLKKGGIILISHVGDRYSNPSVCWMEWVADWNLIYRTEAELKRIFLEAGFSQKNLQIIPQHSKVMQYCFASIN